ncbi:chlorophyll synthesis pathway protein BchC [Lichtheimia ornata]|uniref:L-arabinitol 4-dehydrogenase n=1 Tax=Lichtheimia ornata TaxID=688661 RepID=A0AAD7XU90_9FUNG|nr:chlorophyll synthesis pathway protein BchC [Lichtheimia ornata]KAJ8654680.1 chlorophyll synthesis pathway protein BchC [Lichtheimia ornata]
MASAVSNNENKNYGVLLNKVNDLQVVEIPMPTPKEDEVQVQVKATGICGSDIHLWKHGEIGIFPVTRPQLLGHESAGIVTNVGSNVHDLQIGDRVAIEAGIPCSECDQCMSGRYHLCPTVVFKSTPPYDGLLAKYITHPARWVHKMPEEISYEEGALLEPLSVAIAAIERVGVSFGRSLLVTGCGPIGLMVLAVAKAVGVSPVIVTDVQQSRLEYAEKMGADYTYQVNPRLADVDIARDIRALTPNGEGVEHALECTGIESSFRAAIMATRDAGTCCLVGVGKNDQSLPVNNFAMREVDIRGLFRYHHTYPRAIQLLTSGKLDVKHLITHRFEFMDALKAFDTAADYSTGAIKVQIINGD